MTNDSALKSTPWLPLKDGKNSIAPEDCIRLKGLQPVIEILRRKKARIAHEDDLLPEVVKHPSWEHVKGLCPSGQAVFRKIGDCLKYLPEYSVGSNIAGKLQDFSVKEFIDLFDAASSDTMPACSLLAALLKNSQVTDFEASATSHIFPNVQSQLTPARYVLVLNHLSNPSSVSVSPARRRQIFNHYLSEALQVVDAPTLLPQIRMCNREGEWVEPSTLTLSAANISPKNIVDEAQERILELSRKPNKQNVTVNATDLGRQRLVFDEKALSESAGTLWGELLKWRADDFPEDALAALVVVLGNQDGYPELYKKLSANRRLEAILQQLNISWKGKRFCIKIAETSTVEAANLHGDPFSATVHTTIDSFFDPLPRHIEYLPRPDGDQVFQLRTRPCDPRTLNTKQKLEIIGNSVRTIRSRVWKQDSDFESFWESLSRNEQTEIDVAQEVIIQASAVLLDNQLSVRDSETLKSLFDKLHAAKCTEVISGKDGNREEQQRAINEQRRTREELRNLLINDSAIQSLLLEKIQSRLKAQSYNTSSIPFELFQNADDAVVELEEQCGVPKASAGSSVPLQHTFRIEVDSSENTVRFYHWGRAINRFRFGDRPPVNGYDRDMEKMLVLQGSGKDATEANRTGQFGLGFKCVFFVCDEPKVLSGAFSRFCVKAGIYPERLSPEDESQLREKMRQHEDRVPCTGTVMELRLRSGISPQAVIGKFSALASYSVLFSRSIRSCRIDIDNKQSISSHWTIDSLIPQVSVATSTEDLSRRILLFRLDEATRRNDSTSERCSADYRTLLVHLDRDGLPFFRQRSHKEVEPEFPEIWVTTPTSHSGTGTILINADFDVNPGRTQLRSPETDNNNAIIRSMGFNLGRLLRLLHCQLDRDWTTLSNKFSLPEHVSAETFWVRFWKVCVSYAYPPTDHTHPIRRVLLSRSCGISQLISKRKAIPTGLPEPFHGLVKLSGMKWRTAGLLADEKRWLRCLNLEWFPAVFAPGTIVSSKVAEDLARFVKPEIDNVPALRLTVVIETLLAQTPCMSPEIASKVGIVLDKDLLPEFDSTGDAFSARAHLRQAHFQTKAGTERKAGELRIMQGGRLEYEEERMRASFAPDEVVLSPEYEGVGLEFFLLCRGLVGDETPQTLATWCLAAENDHQKQKAVATYLARGAKAHELHLDAKGTWLEDDNTFEWAISDLSPEEKLVAKGRINRHDVSPPAEPARNELVRSKRPAVEIFQDIAVWWSENKESLVKIHESRVYPYGTFPRIDLDATQDQLKGDATARREWLILLIRGQVYRLGNKDVQHRGFLEFFTAEKLLEQLADGTQDAESLLNSIDEYLDTAGEAQVYFHWMNQFLAYYQLSRWLPRYVSAFLGVTRHNANLADLGTIKDIANLRSSHIFGRSTGLNAPPCSRTLSIGAHFILREVIRARFERSANYVPQTALSCLSFVPSDGVRKLFYQITGNPVFVMDKEHDVWAKAMFAAAADHVEDPTFDCCFDIPFRMLTWNLPELKRKRQEILGEGETMTAYQGEDSVDWLLTKELPSATDL